MDPAFVFPQARSKSDIPSDIYHPLLQIARLGYDADDVKSWYDIITARLLRADSVRDDTPYSVNASEFESSTLVQKLEASIPNEADTSAIPSDIAVDYAVNSSLFTDSFHFDDFAAGDIGINEVAAASPLSAPPTYETTKYETTKYETTKYETTSNFEPSLPWQPKPHSFHLYESTEGSGTESGNFSPWSYYSESSFNAGELSRKRKLSQSPLYQTAIENAMSISATTESSPPIPYSHFGPVRSTELAYLPQISVIPSRKRRKAGTKGVKRFIQPMHISRQSI